MHTVEPNLGTGRIDHDVEVKVETCAERVSERDLLIGLSTRNIRRTSIRVENFCHRKRELLVNAFPLLISRKLRMRRNAGVG